jgi:hypothetical protein
MHVELAIGCEYFGAEYHASQNIVSVGTFLLGLVFYFLRREGRRCDIFGVNSSILLLSLTYPTYA